MLCKIKPILTADQKINRTLLFAAKELQKYLRLVYTDEAPVMATSSYNREENTIYIGVDLKEIPEVSNKELDDAICIDVENFSGVITGNNARSTLIAVYRFLREKGYKFIRPGKDGETIPAHVDGKKVYVCENASYRHRGVCIEGGVYQEFLCDLIDWLPKVAMNEYFIQFNLPRSFLDRWYASLNPYRQAKSLTDDEIKAIVKGWENEIEKRGLLYHTVGHGWTAQAFGIPGNSFDQTDIIPTKEQKSIMAMLNGKRDLYDKTPLNTNLCYGRQDVRDSVVNNIVEYCEEHPHADYLHFWLADATNNHCECDACKDTLPSDYYVKMLNDLDRKLTEKGIDTRVVFLLYYDLLWKPIEEKLINKDRFTLMFAPISRSYSASYNAKDTGVMKPYVRNKLEFPKSIGDCLEYLRDWQSAFDGDSFVFDYHFMWDHYYEFAQYDHAKILYGDITELEALGLNGFVNCQVHRVFTPTSLGMNVLAETLWNKEKPFGEIEKNVLETEFGEKWEVVRDYLKKLSQNSYAKLIRKEAKYDDEYKKRFENSLKILEDFKPQIEMGLKTDLKKNWEKMELHSNLYEMLVKYVRAFNTKEADELKPKINDFSYKNEEKFKDVFDGSYFVTTFRYYDDGLKSAME